MSSFFCPHCGGRLGMYLVTLMGGEGQVPDEAAPGEEMGGVDEVVTETILEVLCGLYAGDVCAGQRPDLRIGRVAEGTRLLIDQESGLEDDERPAVTAKKVGWMVRKWLRLATRRSSQAGRAYVVVWDQERIEELRHEWGVSQERRGAVVGRLRKGGLVGMVDAEGTPVLPSSRMNDGYGRGGGAPVEG